MISLKNIFFAILLIILFQSCDHKSLHMRRFTFAAFNALNDNVKFEKIGANIELQQALKKSGVVNYNYCTIDSISYLVLDMDASFDLAETKLLLNNMSADFSEMNVLKEIVEGKYILLNRIYKMEQTEEYRAEEGQLIPMHKNQYTRFVLTLEIINDLALAKEYVSVHGIGKAWPEITQNMKTVGIHEMELYLMGYSAFLIMDAKPNFDWDVDGKKWGELPREKEWQAYVAKFQKTNLESKAAEKWKTMKMISMHE